MAFEGEHRARASVAAFTIVAVLSCVAALGAQEPTPAPDRSASPRSVLVTLWTAGAHDQPLVTRFGHRYDRGLYIVGVQLRRMIAARADDSLTLSYTVDLLPVVMATNMPAYTTVVAACGAPYPPGCVYDKTVPLSPHDTYGVGIAPVGFVARWRVVDGIGVQLRASGGVAYFQTPVPDPLACRINFIADGGVLADVRVTHRAALLVGARLNHISNGGRGRVNPGMDSRMLELGLSLTR